MLKSSDEALTWQRTSYKATATPQDKINQICYCIRMHNYSKRLAPAILEGRILQDADRLDALGAIGISRTFSIGGSEGRKFYNTDDPFCRSSRDLDDKQWTLDHFHIKLLKLEGFMHTKTARKISRAYKIHDAFYETSAKGNLDVIYIILVTLFYVFILACKHL